jgi:6-pyruvoyltetrahydropterin/6-carboxytetrahydropterin synthase
VTTPAGAGGEGPGGSVAGVSRHRIRVARAEHKFSCAHMTVFPDGRKERLHGHNYTVAVSLELRSIGFQHLVDFSLIKRAVAALCAEWRERTLVAGACPRLERLERRGGEVELVLCGRRYVLPEEDVLILPVDNTTTEALSALWADLLVERLGGVLRGSAAVGLEVTIEESPGQGASSFRTLDA